MSGESASLALLVKKSEFLLNLMTVHATWTGNPNYTYGSFTDMKSIHYIIGHEPIVGNFLTKMVHLKINMFRPHLNLTIET